MKKYGYPLVVLMVFAALILLQGGQPARGNTQDDAFLQSVGYLQATPGLGESTATASLPAVTGTITATQVPTSTPTQAVRSTPTISPTATITATIAAPTRTPLPPFIQVQPREVARTLAARLIYSLLILIAAWPLAALLRWLTIQLLSKIHTDVRIFVGQLVFFAVWIGALLAIFSVFQVEAATVTAIVGSVGLAISLSSQDLFKNFIAGIYLLVERPFSVGDVITVSGNTGTVLFIDLRTTVILTEQKQRVIIPNTLVMSQVVITGTSGDQSGDQSQNK
ncbi:MAG: mechanosensitive ion channel [Anaerolineales bacterium]